MIDTLHFVIVSYVSLGNIKVLRYGDFHGFQLFAMGGPHLTGLLIVPWRGGPACWLGVDSPLRRGGPVGPGSVSVGPSSPLEKGWVSLEGWLGVGFCRAFALAHLFTF